MGKVFRDRHAAGRQLGHVLAGREWRSPVVFGIARGGVPVAAEIARLLDAPLGVAVARKISAPGQPEFGLGAVTAHGPPYFALAASGLEPADLDEQCRAERVEARRRLRHYGTAQPDPAGHDVVLVDDGLATGVTATAALLELRGRGPASIVFAAPVCSPSSCEALFAFADDVVCLITPAEFGAVSRWYRHFPQTSDEEVLAALNR